MRGQVWTEYLVFVALLVLISVLLASYVLPSVKDASLCSAVHGAALEVIEKQELSKGREYVLRGVSCGEREVNVYCVCFNADEVREAVERTLERFGESKSVRVMP